MGHTDQAGPQGYQRQAYVNATVAGPVSAALIQHRAGLPPARVGLPTPDVKGGRSPGCWGKIPPHPLYVATLQCRSLGLSSGMALRWSVRLPRLVLSPSPGSPGWTFPLRRSHGLQLASAVLPPEGPRNIIGPALLRQGQAPSQTRSCSKTRSLDTRLCRFGFAA